MQNLTVVKWFCIPRESADSHWSYKWSIICVMIKNLCCKCCWRHLWSLRIKASTGRWYSYKMSKTISSENPQSSSCPIIPLNKIPDTEAATPHWVLHTWSKRGFPSLTENPALRPEGADSHPSCFSICQTSGLMSRAIMWRLKALTQVQHFRALLTVMCHLSVLLKVTPSQIDRKMSSLSAERHVLFWEKCQRLRLIYSLVFMLHVFKGHCLGEQLL